MDEGLGNQSDDEVGVQVGRANSIHTFKRKVMEVVCWRQACY